MPVIQKTYKNGAELTKIIIYKSKFINSVRFMVSSLSNLIDSLNTNCECYLENANVKYGSLII